LTKKQDSAKTAGIPLPLQMHGGDTPNKFFLTKFPLSLALLLMLLNSSLYERLEAIGRR
jgi:hypothetical protein